MPRQRTVSSRMLAAEIVLLEAGVEEELGDAFRNGNRETSENLEKTLIEVQALKSEAAVLTEDDVTDKKFQLEDRKRRLAQSVFALTSGKRLDQARVAYSQTHSEVSELVRETGNDRERHIMSEIGAREETFLTSSNPEKVQAVVAELERLRFQILIRTPQFLIGMFRSLVDRRVSMNDQVQATQLIENGKRALDRESWDDLRLINQRLWSLVPDEEQASDELRVYTGIV